MLSSHYLGPRSLAQDATAAIELLAERLSIEHSVGQTHTVLLVKGCGDEESLAATATYLVAAIAQTIQANLRIRQALFNNIDLHRDLQADIASVIGDEDSHGYFKTKQRDPWMWEAISHMLIHLSRYNAEFHPSGHVLAKTGLKYDVNDHGLDLIAIYKGARLGISAGECKAYLHDPSRAITDASNRLSEIDENKRDIELRAAITQLRGVLDDDVQIGLAGAFWRDERSYLPFICCEEARSVNWMLNRSVLQRLNVPIDRKVLYPIPLVHGRATLDRICEFMRSYVAIGA